MEYQKKALIPLAAAIIVSGSCLLAVWAETSERQLSQTTSVVIERYEYPAVSLGQISATSSTGQIDNDRHIRLGGFSDLWRGSSDSPGEFWIVADQSGTGKVRRSSPSNAICVGRGSSASPSLQ